MENYEIGQTVKEPNNTIRSTESIMIPKHRFDCVNLCLKETKQALREKVLEAELQKARIAELDKELLEAKAETALAILDTLNKSVAKYFKKSRR